MYKLYRLASGSWVETGIRADTLEQLRELASEAGLNWGATQWRRGPDDVDIDAELAATALAVALEQNESLRESLRRLIQRIDLIGGMSTHGQQQDLRDAKALL